MNFLNTVTWVYDNHRREITRAPWFISIIHIQLHCARFAIRSSSLQQNTFQDIIKITYLMISRRWYSNRPKAAQYLPRQWRHRIQPGENHLHQLWRGTEAPEPPPLPPWFQLRKWWIFIDPYQYQYCLQGVPNVWHHAGAGRSRTPSEPAATGLCLMESCSRRAHTETVRAHGVVQIYNDGWWECRSGPPRADWW